MVIRMCLKARAFSISVTIYGLLLENLNLSEQRNERRCMKATIVIYKQYSVMRNENKGPQAQFENIIKFTGEMIIIYQTDPRNFYRSQSNLAYQAISKSIGSSGR